MLNLRLSPEEKKTVYILFGLTFLYILPTIISNTPYNDDFSRIIIGNSWDDDGRLLPSILVRLLNHATTIYSPAPLPLLLSVPIFVLGGLLVRRLFVDLSDPYLSGIISFGFIVNPFLICLFPYQLDSLGLALSLVLLLVPYALVIPSGGKKQLFYYYAKCSLCLFLSLNSYQASLGFFMSLAVMELVHKVSNGEQIESISSLYRRVVQLVVGFVAYKLFLKLFFIANIARRASGAETVSFSAEGFGQLVDNSVVIVSSVFDALSQQQIILFSLLFLVCIVFCIMLYKRAVLGSDLKALQKMALLVVPFAPVILFLFSFVHMALLKDSAALNLQVLTSFCGLFAFMFLVPGWLFRSSIKTYCVLAPVLISAFGFSYIMGNLVKIEADFHEPQLASIVEKINDSNPHRDNIVYYSGGLSHSKYYYRLEDTFPLIHSLDTGSSWSVKYKLPYYGCAVNNYRDISDDAMYSSVDRASLPVIADSFYYTLYRYNSDFLLEFKKR